jgi:hypothetical protein
MRSSLHNQKTMWQTSAPLCIEAEKAFRQGGEKEAERLGHLAISSARGLQKYVLVQSLERQRKNPNRHSFF